MTIDMLRPIIEHKKAEIRAAKVRVPDHRIRSAAHTRLPARPLVEALEKTARYGCHVIAEIKRASPSKGVFRRDLDPARYAVEYEKGGASAVSVLTDRRFFMGRPEDLITARKATTLPVLRKDFILSSYQLYESAAMGADAVLLIVRVLAPQQLRDYLQLTRELGMDALVEVHAEPDLEVAFEAGARLIGINNRNLATFETDIQTCIDTASRLRSGQTAVAASGIHTPQDLERIRQSGIPCALIGESLVRAPDPRAFLKHLWRR